MYCNEVLHYTLENLHFTESSSWLSLNILKIEGGFVGWKIVDRDLFFWEYLKLVLFVYVGKYFCGFMGSGYDLVTDCSTMTINDPEMAVKVYFDLNAPLIHWFSTVP